MIDQLQRAEEANWQWMSLSRKCHSIAWLPPALHNSWSNECFLQSFALRNEHNGTGYRISCQVSIQHHATPSQQYENPILIMLQLPQTTLSSICISRCQDHTANNGWLWACYGERVGLLFQSLLLTHGPSWTIIMVHFNNGDNVLSWFRHGCLPPLVLVLQLISSATVKEHKQAGVVSAFCTMLMSTCKAERDRIRKCRADTE